MNWFTRVDPELGEIIITPRGRKLKVVEYVEGKGWCETALTRIDNWCLAMQAKLQKAFG